jgi:hypothetical protein
MTTSRRFYAKNGLSRVEARLKPAELRCDTRPFGDQIFGVSATHDERELAVENARLERRWDTRVGTIELRIPKVTAGAYFPSLLEPRRRAEKALHAVVVEAYVKGVSTREGRREATSRANSDGLRAGGDPTPAYSPIVTANLPREDLAPTRPRASGS